MVIVAGARTVDSMQLARDIADSCGVIRDCVAMHVDLAQLLLRVASTELPDSCPQAQCLSTASLPLEQHGNIFVRIQQTFQVCLQILQPAKSTCCAENKRQRRGAAMCALLIAVDNTAAFWERRYLST